MEPLTHAGIQTWPGRTSDTDVDIKTEPGRTSDTDADIKTVPETTPSSAPGSVAGAEGKAVTDSDTVLEPACTLSCTCSSYSQKKRDSHLRPITGQRRFMRVDVGEPISGSKPDEDTAPEPDTGMGAEAGVTVKVETLSESETEMVVKHSRGQACPASVKESEGVCSSVTEQPEQNYTLGKTAAQSRTQGPSEDDNSFSCNRCAARFTEFDHFSQHLRLHAGLKPFACPKCECSFKSNSHLKVHRRIHTGQKPFSCQEWIAAFSRSSSLKSHVLKKHNPPKQCIFSCSERTAIFSSGSEVKGHKQAHKESLSCNEWKAVFSHSSNLKRHMVKFHTTLPVHRLHCCF